MKKEIYISCDIESDGPIPGPNSLLSIGSAAFIDSELIGTFSANLKQLPDAKMDVKTKTEFWDKNPIAWEACRENTEDPIRAMKRYVDWLKGLEQQYNYKVVFVGYPAGFDFTFIYWYLIKFVNYSPFSFSCIDMKTLSMAIMKKPFRDCTKRAMPKKWFDEIKAKGLVHSHIALDDAIEQGYLFCAMMKEIMPQS
ncbi:MAG: exonuclease [bacterium]|nr:exonuclease [bacterium]